MSQASIIQTITAASLSLLLGCASPPPRQDIRGDLPQLPETWVADPEYDGPVSDDWWRELGSPPLEDLVREALTYNHDLRATAARLEAALAQARIAGADQLPQADFGFNAQRQQQKFVGLPIPGAGNQVLTSRSTVYGASLNLSWELDLWGRIRNATAAALADVQASEQQLRAAQLSLVAQTIKAWLAAVEAHHQLALAQATAENHRTTAAQVRERYERGIRPPLDLRLALTSESSAAAVVALRNSRLQSAIRQLEILAGRYPAAALATTNDLPELTGEVPAGLPSELLDRRPDLLAAERRLAATVARTREAKAALFPRIALTASGGRTSAELEDLLSSQFNVWSIAANLAQPVFQGGRLRANVRLNEARARESLESYAATALQAFGEVETSLANEELLRARAAQLAEAATQSTAALALAEERYRSGLEDFVTVMEAQRRAFENESQLLAVRRELLANRIDLHLALGGGFREPEPETVTAHLN